MNVVVEMLAKDAEEATSWVRACQLARKWAERNARTRLGLAPLNPAAMKLVGARKLAKKHELCLKAACLFAWIDAACARAQLGLSWYLASRRRTARSGGSRTCAAADNSVA